MAKLSWEEFQAKYDAAQSKLLPALAQAGFTFKKGSLPKGHPSDSTRVVAVSLHGKRVGFVEERRHGGGYGHEFVDATAGAAFEAICTETGAGYEQFAGWLADGMVCANTLKGAARSCA